jgi:hypothetical protein
MNDTQKQALKDFARLHGANWKQALHKLWMSGADTGALRQIRNSYMPVVMSKQFTIEGV